MFSLNQIFGFILLAFAVILLIQCRLSVGQFGFEEMSVPRPARPNQLEPFLKNQNRVQFKGLTQTDDHKNYWRRVCASSDKFKACCYSIGMTSSMVNVTELVETACDYPPGPLSNLQKMALAHYFNEYVMCYTDGNDNTQCCADNDVPEEGTSFWFKVKCRDLCRGVNVDLSVNPAWDDCSRGAEQIYKCNRRSSNFTNPSAAYRNGFCKVDKYCSTPMGWQEACVYWA